MKFCNKWDLYHKWKNVKFHDVMILAWQTIYKLTKRGPLKIYFKRKPRKIKLIEACYYILDKVPTDLHVAISDVAYTYEIGTKLLKQEIT